jgi:hypothetical protein
MNDAPPEASSEYSRGVSGVRRIFGAERRPEAAAARLRIGARAVIVGGGFLGALLLVVAEFTTLFQLHISTTTIAIRSEGTGPHHAYAMALIAVCAAALTLLAWRGESRPALLGIGVLGLAALLIALIRDLSAATGSGIVTVAGHYVEAGSKPSAGFYMETLGAVLLLIACVWGFLLAGSPPLPRSPQSGS